MVETRDLILRPGSVEDWQDLYRNLWSQESAFRFLFSKPSASEEAARKKTAAYAEMHKEVRTEFFVVEKATGQAIGIAGIKELNQGVYTVTDIAIGPGYTGRGYGKQILSALITLAFDNLDAQELHYECFTQNEVSKRLALSCGFNYSHSEEAELKKDGKPVLLAHFIRRKPHV